LFLPIIPALCKRSPEAFICSNERFLTTLLSACIFLPLLLYSGGVFPIPLQKPQMLFDRPRTEIFKNVLPCTFLNYEFFNGKTRFCLNPLTSCQYEFDISSNSLSSVVQGRAMLDSGYRFNRCP